MGVGGWEEAVSTEENKYTAGGRAAPMWTFISGNGGGVPYTLGHLRMTADKYRMDRDGQRQILAMGGVKLMTFANNMFLGSGRGRAVEVVDLDHRVEALFGLVGFLATYVVDGNTAARYRSSALQESLARSLVEIRDCSGCTASWRQRTGS